jgi:predicted 2-oxoglutarate/Fe(II)-dependent dioxygenase YbiX
LAKKLFGLQLDGQQAAGVEGRVDTKVSLRKDLKPVEEAKKKKIESKVSRKLQRQDRMSVAELKQTVTRPDVVEMHGITSSYPKLVVQ